MANKKDYYEILGVPRTANAKELKAAYRKLARKFHPDVNTDNPGAEDRFKEIAEAFAVLSDKDKRAKYDQRGHEAFDAGFNPFAGANPQDFETEFGNLSDLFSMFGRGGGAGFGGGHRATRPRRGEDLKLEVRVPFVDAVRGSTVEMTIPRHVACADCSGTGVGVGARDHACPDCHGTGRVEQGRGGFRLAMTCTRCGGSGRQSGDPCRACSGSGRRRMQDRVKVRIPAGVEDGGTVRIAGRGDAGLNGAPAGDAYLSIRVEAHPDFRREGRDLYVDVPVGLAEAGLGGPVVVPTLDGESTINIPEGTKSSQKFRLRGQGVAASAKHAAGDLYAVIQIHPPKKLTKRSRELLEQFKKLND